MSFKRDCISCEYAYSRIDYGECGDCGRKSNWIQASEPELQRRVRHINKVLKEKYNV